MVVQFFFAVAFSAVPLTLYVQSMRHLMQFVSSIEEIVRETSGYHRRVVPRFRPVPLLAPCGFFLDPS
ncbi:Glycine receptor subunit alpha-4 [Bienertia sinuspersici]